MNLVALPAFTDNYIWMLHDGRQAIVVDPGEAEPVQRALQALGLQLQGILVTHHHGDHVGALAALEALLRGPVYAPSKEPMPVAVQGVHGGQTLELMGLRIEVLDVPGHTAGHIAFYLPAPAPGQAPVLFCGDTLFSAGCGRVFEGTPPQLHASLQRLASLPGDTRVCCAHEYTLSNLRFARTIEPQNEALARHEAWCRQQRASNLPTLPSTLSLELQINPFLRCEQPSVVQAALQHDPAVPAQQAEAVFACLRQWKNEFR